MAEEIIVEIPQGKLRGSKEETLFGETYYSFQQIPYGKPPVGELRFKSPVPADGWTGIRDATKSETTAPSNDFFTYKYVKESDEDCLNLHVFIKKLPNQLGNKKLPVLVWIHGGGYTYGAGNKDAVGPDFLITHDVVIVSCNYRLGPLGFLSLRTPECPGNFGLKDQRLALKWIQNNVSHFGGDPNNVTLFGVSAGGSSVHYLNLSQSCKGLFHRAIALSGAAMNCWGYSARPRESAFLLGKRLGCDTEDDSVLLNFLRKASAKDVIEKAHGIMHEVEGERPGEMLLNFSFAPTWEPENEDAIITKPPLEILDEGNVLNVPYITGACSNEMLMGIKDLNDVPNWTKDEEFQALIPKHLEVEKDTKLSLEIAKRIREFFFKDGINVDNFLQVLSDNFFVYGIYKAIKARITNEKITTPTYAYVFAYDTGRRNFIRGMLGDKGIKGASHGDDIGYLFNPKFPDMPVKLPKPEGADLDVTDRFVQIVINFATNGTPTNQRSEIEWPPVEANKNVYLEMNEKFSLKQGFFEQRMEFWDSIYDLVAKSQK